MHHQGSFVVNRPHAEYAPDVNQPRHFSGGNYAPMTRFGVGDNVHHSFTSRRDSPGGIDMNPRSIPALNRLRKPCMCIQAWIDVLGYAFAEMRLENTAHDGDIEMLNQENLQDNIDDVFMSSNVDVNIGTEALPEHEVRLEHGVRFEDRVHLGDETGISPTSTDNSPNPPNGAFLGSSSFMPSLIGGYIDVDEEVVPYNWDIHNDDTGQGLFDEVPPASGGYYEKRLNEAYARASLDTPIPQHRPQDPPPNVVIEEPIPVVDKKDKGKQGMFDVQEFPVASFTLDGTPSLVEHFQNLSIDPPRASDCPSSTARHLSALLGRDGPSEESGPAHSNIFSSNSFQLNYLSALEKEPLYYRLLQQDNDTTGPGWMANLKEMRQKLTDRTNRPGSSIILRTPVKGQGKSDKENKETGKTEEMSPLFDVDLDLSDQDPFAVPATPTRIVEPSGLRFKDLPIDNTFVDDSDRSNGPLASPTPSGVKLQSPFQLRPKSEPPQKPKPGPKFIYKPPAKLEPITSSWPQVSIRALMLPSQAKPEPLGGKILLWHRPSIPLLPPPPEATLPSLLLAKVTTTTRGPPSKMPKKPKKRRSKEPKQIITEATRPGPAPDANESVQDIPKEKTPIKYCNFPGGYPFVEDDEPEQTGSTVMFSLLEVVVRVIWKW